MFDWRVQFLGDKFPYLFPKRYLAIAKFKVQNISQQLWLSSFDGPRQCLNLITFRCAPINFIEAVKTPISYHKYHDTSRFLYLHYLNPSYQQKTLAHHNTWEIRCRWKHREYWKLTTPPQEHIELLGILCASNALFVTKITICGVVKYGIHISKCDQTKTLISFPWRLRWQTYILMI